MSDVSIQILAAAQSISTYAHEQMRWIAEKSEDQAVQQECYLFAEAIDRAVHELVSPFASDIRGYLDQVAPSAPPPPGYERSTMELPNLRRSVAARVERRPPSAIEGSSDAPFPSVSSQVAGDLGSPLVDLDLETVAEEVAAEVRWS